MSALGFRVTVTKWLSLVRLLLGEVPEHSELTAPGMAEPLAAYFSIAQAVRAGDLIAFRCTSFAVAPKCTDPYCQALHRGVASLRRLVEGRCGRVV
jgi:26S proteasome regulatory subunit N3